PYRYCSKMLFAEYLQDLADLSVTIPNDGTYSFTITGAESSDRDDLRVTCNGISLDGMSFRTYYSNLIGMYPTGEASMPENAGAPVFEINYKTKKGSSHSLKFYSINDRNCAVNIDGETHLSVRITEVEKAINNLHKLLKGQSIT
ncbi:MAG: hypothetical protein II337_05585, partial [Clostridia bacterium]|nr:hypothetical protein [Clostridia bacterium]